MGFEFDTTQYAPATGDFELLEPGDYRLQVDEVSDETATKDGTGAYVTLKYAVVEGDREGAHIFANYNIRNKNPKAMEIAWRELAALGQAIGTRRGHSDDLLYKPFWAKVGIEKSKDPQYKDKNKILKFYAPDSAPGASPPPAAKQSPPPTPAPAPAAQPRAAASGGKPWSAKR